MNKCIFIGRLVADPEVRYSQGENSTCIARYRLAIDRKFKKDGEQTADFINCVAFGKNGEFVEKYLHKGMKIAVVARVQTGSYTNNNGVKVYTTDFVVEEHEFCESKNSNNSHQSESNSDDGFVPVPDGISDEELPFC